WLPKQVNMGKTRWERQEGERLRRRRGDSIALSVPPFSIAIVITSLVAGGCNGVHKAQGDPLFGGVKPQPGLTGASNSPVPPLPGPTSTASTAALASVNPRPLDGSHDLRISDPAGSSPAIGGQGFGTQLQQPVMGAPPTQPFAP